MNSTIWIPGRVGWTWLAAPLFVAVAVAGCGSAEKPRTEPIIGGALPQMPIPMVGQALLAGRVLDADGLPVAGATVSVAETDVRVTTDAAGAYQVTVPSDSTVTLGAGAAGFASTFRASVMVASQSMVSAFDFVLLLPAKVAAINALGAPGKESMRGAMAIRLHSMDAACATTGARATVWPPLAGKVVYSQPAVAGGLAEPDASLTEIAAGSGINFWLAATMPPGNGLAVEVQQNGCQLVGSPSLGGLVFTGQRHVAAQSLTQVDLFLGVTP